MRIRTVAVAALLVLPSVVAAQVGRVPPPLTGGTIPRPAPLPPAAPEVGRALAIQRARWALESYSLVSVVQMPQAQGIAGFTSLGAGAHGDYRFGERWSGTVDVTASLPYFDVGMTSQTVELGSRYILPPWDRGVRPYFDARAAYLGVSDVWSVPSGGTYDLNQYARWSKGVGLIGGVGMELPFTSRFAISTEISAVRSRMFTSSISGPTAMPVGQGYWMTSARWSVALKYSRFTRQYLANTTKH